MIQYYYILDIPLNYTHSVSVWSDMIWYDLFFIVFTEMDDTSDSDSDSEIVITSRSAAEFNQADTVVHLLFIYFV